jgi:hypothetical protein
MNLFKKLFKKKEYLVCESTITQVLNEKQVVVDKGYSNGITIDSEIDIYIKHGSDVEGINQYLEYNGSGEILQIEETFTVVRPFEYRSLARGLLYPNFYLRVGDIMKFKLQIKK